MLKGNRRRYFGENSLEPMITAEEYLNGVPLLSPKEISRRLNELNYEGQEDARRGVCLVAYRHIKRLKLLHIKKIARNSIPPRSNAILIGPTGCGKSYIIELLFGEILKLPYVIVEMTRFSETGYVGDDVLNILNQLVDAARGNLCVAECGVLALDEFDKIAASSSYLRFAGQGTTKDVSGYGVQRELLKMIEGGDIQIPLDYGFSHYGPRGSISTRDITFFAIGAFSGFKDLDYYDKKIGFLQEIKEAGEKEKIAYRLNVEEAEDINRFHTYGFIPELIARFERIIPFMPLDTATLKRILYNKVQKHKLEFQEEGFDLCIDDNVFDFFVKEALNKKTGARGLESAIIKYIEDFGFEYFGQNKTGIVSLKIRNGKLRADIKVRA